MTIDEALSVKDFFPNEASPEDLCKLICDGSLFTVLEVKYLEFISKGTEYL